MPNVTVNPIQTISVRVDSGKQTVVQSTSQFVGAQNPDIANSVAYLQATNNTQNASIIAIQNVNNTQNTNIQSAFNRANSATVLAQSAFDKANTGGGGGISGSGYLANSVIFANTTGYLSNTGGLAYYTSNSTFVATNISATSISQNGVNLLTYSQSAFEQANTASANTIYAFGVDNAQNTLITTANSVAQAAFIAANTAAANTVYLQGGLNTANANITVIQGINDTQNTSIQSAFNLANTLQGGLNTANASITVIQGVNLTQNNSINVIQGGLNTANANIAYSLGVDLAQNNSISLLQGGLNTANANIASLIAVNTTQNNSINLLQGGLNTANANIAYSLGVDLTQNNSITAAFNLANTLQGGLNTANASIIAIQGINDAQNSSISIIQGINDTQNSSITAIQGVNTVQNTNITILQSVNLTQNTNISNASGLAQSAFDNSNTKFNSSGGTISGSVTIQNNLIVQGNVNYVGNVNSIQVTGNTGQFFGYAANGFNALYAGIPTGYLVEPQTVYQMTGNYDGYAALNMQNINTGPNSSFDLFITADNGSVTDGFLDLGLGSSNYNYPGYSLLGRNDGYLFVTGNTTTGGGNMIVGTGLNNDVIFATGGLNVQNEVMRISGVAGSNTVIIKSNISSTNTQTGALQVRGGLGVTGNVYAGNVYSGGSLVLTSEPIGSSAASNTVYLQGALNSANANISLLQGGLNTANANIAYILGVDLAQNTSISLLQGGLNTANANIAYILSVDLAQNTLISNANTVAQGAFIAANTAAANTIQLQGGLNTANANIVSLIAVNTTQNNSINLLQGGLNTANANIAYILGVDLTQNNSINLLQGGLNTANANITYILGVDLAQNNSINLFQDGLNTANANIAYILGVDLAQNTSISVAYEQANSKTFTFTQNTAPATANNADRWLQIDTGVVYQNFGNTTNPVWAEFGPGGTVSNTSNATVSTVYSNQYVLTGTTTNATETEIFVSPTFTRIPVAANTVVYYTADITCRRTDVSGDYGSFFLKGVAANSSAGVVTDVGLIYELIVARTDANFLVDLQADNTNKSVKVLVTGATGKTLSWKCVINTVEV